MTKSREGRFYENYYCRLRKNRQYDCRKPLGSADLYIAVADSDELNMLSCFLARKMGAKNTIARIRTPEYNDKSLSVMKNNLEISLPINPERLAARELFNILKFPSAVKIETFSHRNMEMLEVVLKENSVFDGVKLCDAARQA